MSLFKKMHAVSYFVTDWERAKEFYGKMLGLGPMNSNDQMGWCEFGGQNETHVAISLWRGPGPLPTNGGITIFDVDDAYAAIAELRKRGVRCDDVIALPGMVTFADFYDPDGNRLELAGPPPPAA
jgi:catechol 2,3-dioxygenase-like lactoylglutathione lyase family enzyme